MSRQNSDERTRRQHYRRHPQASRERRDGEFPGDYAGFRARRSHGWGIGLYRNRRDGRIFGVAAGLADYWDVADWVVRLMFIGAFIFTGMLAVWAYLAGCVLLSPRPDQRRGRQRSPAEAAGSFAVDRESVAEARRQGAPGEGGRSDPYGPDMEYDEERHDYRPKRIFRYSDSASVRLARARERMDDALRRVESMERYVTSRRFRLNREFSRL
jgi:phage shock protein C